MAIEFGEHLPAGKVSGMATQLEAYGTVHPGTSSRAFVIEVFRSSNLPLLKDQLTSWEHYGFLKWRSNDA